MAMPSALARYHASKRGTTTVARRSITTSPKFQKTLARVKGASKRAHNIAKEAEVQLPLMTLAGAAVPALYTRYTGKSLPSVGGIDPELLAGGLLIAASFALKGSTRRTVAAIGSGCAAPALSRAIKTGSVRTGGIEIGADDDDDDDDETSGI